MKLKKLLAPHANSYAMQWGSTAGDFRDADTCADTEVFYAYAKHVGPIYVANRTAGRTIQYIDKERRSQPLPCIIHLRNRHFTLLNFSILKSLTLHTIVEE